jgi:hypothetical protein
LREKWTTTLEPPQLVLPSLHRAQNSALGPSTRRRAALETPTRMDAARDATVAAVFFWWV